MPARSLCARLLAFAKIQNCPPLSTPPLRQGRSGGVVEIVLGGLAEQPEGRGRLLPSPKLGEGAVGGRGLSDRLPIQTDISGTTCHLP